MNTIIDLYRRSFTGLSRDILLLAFVTLINRSGTMIVPFLTIYLTFQKGFSLEQAGIVMTFFGLGSLLGNYVGGKITDIFGAYKVQIWTLIASGLGFILMIYLEGFWVFTIGIFFVNAMAEAFRPANLAAINIYSKPENRVRSVSLIRLAINLGFAIGPAVGGLLIVYLGYNWLFIIDGLTCILAAIAFWYLLEDKTSEEVQQKEQHKKIKIYEIFKNTPFVVVMTCQLLGAISFFQLFTTFPIYIKDSLGYADTYVGYLMAMNGIFIAIVEMPIIFLIENKYRRIILIAIGNILMGFAWYLFNISFWEYMPILVVLLISFAEIIDFPFNYSLAVSLSDKDNQGVYMGVYTMTFSVAFILAPSIGTYMVAHYGFYHLWNLALVLNLVAGLGMYFYFKNKTIEE